LKGSLILTELLLKYHDKQLWNWLKQN
jgi:hypothetical protein